MLYQTHCQNCSKDTTRKLSFQEYDQVKDGSMSLSCACGGAAHIVFDPSQVSFVLKDGESGGWATKAQKENRYRKERHGTLGRKQRDHVKPNKLIPNYRGQVAGSWSEAQDAARQSTYERVSKEHGAREGKRAAQESAKTFNKYVKEAT